MLPRTCHIGVVTLAPKWLLGFLLTLCCQAVLAQAMYRIKPLGYLGGCTSSGLRAAGLNNADEVAGSACNANGDTHAFLWKNNATPMVDLGPTEVGSTSTAHALSASGLVAGSASDSTGMFVFESPGGGAPMTRIYDGLGGTQIEAYAVNGAGQLTGYATLPGDTLKQAFMWKNDGSPMIDLGSGDYEDSSGAAINEFGQMSGSVVEDAYASTCVWKNDGSPLAVFSLIVGKISPKSCPAINKINS